MYKFGDKSLRQYNTLHRDLQIILSEAIKIIDFSILEGIRTTERQKKLFKEGRSKLDGVNKKSKHQGKKDKEGNFVSFAVDIMPYKKGTNAFSGKQKDKNRFYFLMGIIKGITQKLIDENKITHNVRFGLDWDGDFQFDDQSFDDLPHMELINIGSL